MGQKLYRIETSKCAITGYMNTTSAQRPPWGSPSIDRQLLQHEWAGYLLLKDGDAATTAPAHTVLAREAKRSWRPKSWNGSFIEWWTVGRGRRSAHPSGSARSTMPARQIGVEGRAGRAATSHQTRLLSSIQRCRGRAWWSLITEWIAR